MHDRIPHDRDRCLYFSDSSKRDRLSIGDACPITFAIITTTTKWSISERSRLFVMIARLTQPKSKFILHYSPVCLDFDFYWIAFKWFRAKCVCYQWQITVNTWGVNKGFDSYFSGIDCDSKAIIWENSHLFLRLDWTRPLGIKYW